MLVLIKTTQRVRQRGVCTHTHMHTHTYRYVLLCSATDACLSKSACRYAWLAIWCDPRPTATAPPPSTSPLHSLLSLSFFLSNHPPEMLCSSANQSARFTSVHSAGQKSMCTWNKTESNSLSLTSYFPSVYSLPLSLSQYLSIAYYSLSLLIIIVFLSLSQISLICKG